MSEIFAAPRHQNMHSLDELQPVRGGYDYAKPEDGYIIEVSGTVFKMDSHTAYLLYRAMEQYVDRLESCKKIPRFYVEQEGLPMATVSFMLSKA